MTKATLIAAAVGAILTAASAVAIFIACRELVQGAATVIDLISRSLNC